MYFLLKILIFHCYVRLPEGINLHDLRKLKRSIGCQVAVACGSIRVVWSMWLRHPSIVRTMVVLDYV